MFNLTYKIASAVAGVILGIGLYYYAESKFNEIDDLKHQLQVANMQVTTCEQNKQLSINTLNRQMEIVKEQSNVPDEVNREMDNIDEEFTILASGGMTSKIKEKLCSYCIEYKEITNEGTTEEHSCYWDGVGFRLHSKKPTK